MENKEIQQIESGEQIEELVVKSAEGQTEEQSTECVAPKTKIFPSFADVLMMVALFFVANLAVGVVVALMNISATPLAHLLIYGSSMLLALVLMTLYCIVRKQKPSPFRYKFHWYNSGLIIWGLAAIGAVGIVEEPLLSLMPRSWLDSVNQTIGTGVWAICSLVVLAPIFEELIFRGVILGSLRQRFGVLASIVLSSLLFGVVHIVPQQAINAALVGVILGGVYVATESMPAVIILHAINNGLSYLQYVTNPGGDGTMRGMLADDMSYRQVYIASCVFLIVSILLIVWLCRRNRSRKRVGETVLSK